MGGAWRGHTARCACVALDEADTAAYYEREAARVAAALSGVPEVQPMSVLGPHVNAGCVGMPETEEATRAALQALHNAFQTHIAMREDTAGRRAPPEAHGSRDVLSWHGDAHNDAAAAAAAAGGYGDAYDVQEEDIEMHDDGAPTEDMVRLATFRGDFEVCPYTFHMSG